MENSISTMANIKKDEIITEVVETGSDITGSIGGAVIGTLIAGPVGSIVGGVSGVIVTKLFKKIGAEIKERVLTSREEIRIGAVYTFALNKISQNENIGKTVRTDNFFSSRKNDRPYSEEILEGIVLTAQREYEERKIKFLGNLYGNICTNESIDSDQANQLIKITNTLTFRQFSILALYYEKQEKLANGKEKNKSLEQRNKTPFDIVSEVKDLNQKGLLHTNTTYVNIDGFSLDSFNITSGGKFYYHFLELNQIEKIELEKLNLLVQIV